MKNETRVILQQLVEKAQKLRDFRFDEHVKSVGLSMQAKRTEDEEWVIDFGLPDVKEQDAFLLTFRMFIQQNESISFQNIHGLLRDNELSKELRDGIISVRRAYFNYIRTYAVGRI